MADNLNRRRVVVQTGRRAHNVRPGSYRRQPGEGTVAIALIAAAALATFAALLITSRPYDPMNSSIAPQLSVPSPIALAPSPKPSPSSTSTPVARATETPEAAGETAPPDDATIKSAIERTFSSDAALSDADITIMVENGSVTLVGSVSSADLKQRAERILRGVKGIRAINNQLLVTQPSP